MSELYRNLVVEGLVETKSAEEKQVWRGESPRQTVANAAAIVREDRARFGRNYGASRPGGRYQGRKRSRRYARSVPGYFD